MDDLLPPQPPAGKKRKSNPVPGETLKRNSACLNCRNRKLKCDGLHPVCTTCSKSLRYALEHLKNGVPPPPCKWEDASFAGPSRAPSKGPKRARKSALGSDEDNVSSAAESSRSTGTHTPAVKAGGPSSFPASAYPTTFPQASERPPLPPGHTIDTFPSSFPPPDPIRRPTSALEDAHTLASLPWLLRPDLMPQPPAGSYSHTHADTFPPRAPPPPQQQPARHSFARVSTQPAQPPRPAYEGNFQHASSSVYPTTAAGAPKPSVDPPTFMSGMAYLQTHEDLPAECTIDTVYSSLFDRTGGVESDPSNGSPSFFPSPAMSADKGKGQEQPEGSGLGAELPFSQAVMTALFWPGWPPYLPAPDKMHRIVETFFGCAHMASNLINKRKLLQCLALPPVSADFPHPALLHAICAASSRFLGNVYMEPPELAAFPDDAPRAHHRNALSDAGSNRPSWDGIGRRPASARSGIDGDFGEIHATYALLYMEDSISDASCWQAIVQASTLVAHYYVQHAKWSANCLLSARAIRMLTPLALHLKDAPAEVEKLFPGPQDGIEISERRNLFWSIFAIDTLSSAASAWAGCLDDRVVTCPIPWCDASGANVTDDGSRDSPQSIHSYSIFTQHSPDVSSTQLMYKAILLVRRCNEFLRLAKTLDLADPRESSEFRRLDALLSSFRQGLPAEYRNPVRLLPSATMTAAIDLDGLMIHICSLASIIQLHENFAKSKDSDYSLLRMLAAARGIIGICHQLAATSFDLSRLPPFGSFAFFLAARCSSHVLRRAVKSGDRAMEGACRSEMELLKAAMNQVGQRLPIGVRTTAMCTAILEDINTFHSQTMDALMIQNFNESFQAPVSSKSSTAAGGEVNFSALDHALEERISLEVPASSRPPWDKPATTPSRWIEQLAVEVEEERRTLGTAFESMWTSDSLLEQTLREM